MILRGSIAEDCAQSDDYDELLKRDCLDQEALKEYLESLTLYAPSQAYPCKDRVSSPDLSFELRSESDYHMLCCFRGDHLYVTCYNWVGGEFSYISMYYLSQTPDYAYLRSLMGEPQRLSELGLRAQLP